jgi:hypothetical protein
MKGARYTPDRRFERAQSREPDTKRYMGDVAQHIVDRAKSNTPSGFMGQRKRLRATRDGEVFGGPAWHLVEFGTVTTSPRAPIRRAVEQLGLRLVKS